MNARKEIDFYNEIALELVKQFEANLDGNVFVVKPLIGEIGSALRTLIANGYSAGELLQDYSRSVYKLHLDISILVENTLNNKFEIIVFEIKNVNKLGLSELSQLIGYCLVSRSQFGVLINIDRSLSGEFSVILDGDKDLTEVIRLINNEKVTHNFGVMVWNSTTLKIEYTNSGSIKSMPHLVELVEHNLIEC